MRVTTRELRFRGIEELRVTVQFNMKTGDWSLPPESDDNRVLYGRIERGLSTVLPRGVRIRDLRIGSEGIEFSVDPSEGLTNLAERA